MATSANLLGNEIHKVQEDWGGKRDLQAANQFARFSSEDIHFFRIVAPNELPKIMGLEGICSPKALQWWSGLTYCPWCGKEGQNEGMVVSHLQIMHYHLDLICTCCLGYFTMGADVVWWHTQLCKYMAAGNDDDWKESPPDYGEDDNSDGDFDFTFEGD